MFGVRVKGFGNLNGQFARRRQHERLNLRTFHIDILQNGQSKSRRFAGSGLRLPDHVFAFQKQRNCFLLNRRWNFIAKLI